MIQESTTPLLRPRQTADLKEEVTRLRAMLSAPPHIANRVEDRGQLTKNLRASEHDLQTQAPKPYDSSDIDSARSRADHLKTEMLEGMPTQEEMRRNPPGAVDKHRLWEKRNKKKLNEWKNIGLRLHQSGFGELADATDVVNFEQYRPTGGSQQMNMDNAQIPGAIQFGPTPGAGPATVFSDEETATLEAIDPELRAQLALMDNDKRAMVKNFIRNMGSPGNEQPKRRVKRKRNLTPEQRKEIGQRLAAARWAKKQEG